MDPGCVVTSKEVKESIEPGCSGIGDEHTIVIRKQSTLLERKPHQTDTMDPTLLPREMATQRYVGRDKQNIA